MALPSPWIEETRNKIQVIIFGAYRPTEAQRRLANLRDFMRLKGYTGTFLVADLPEPPIETGEDYDEYVLRKSEYWVERCDVGMDVFMCGGDNTGVGQELRHLCDDLPDRVWRHTVFLDKKCSASSLIKGLGKRWSGTLDQYWFTTEEDLSEAVYGRMPNYIRKLYYQVRGKNPF